MEYANKFKDHQTVQKFAAVVQTHIIYDVLDAPSAAARISGSARPHLLAVDFYMSAEDAPLNISPTLF
jgi:hypothetical protein